jgi:hypothetical protein
MTTANSQERRFARSIIPQNNYQTATDLSDLTKFKEFLVSDNNLATHEVKTEDNKEESTGHFIATEEYPTVNDTTRKTERRISAEEVGSDLYLAHGSVTTTTPDSVNAAAVRKHVFKMQDLSAVKQGPAMTLVEIVGGAINRALPSMVVEDFGFKGSGVGRVSQTMDLRGSGLITTPSGLTAADIETIRLTGLHPFMHTMMKLTIADAGSLSNPTDYSASGNYVESWDFGLKKTLLADQGYTPGAGLYFIAATPTSGAIRSECLIDTYEYTLNFVVRLLSQSNELAALRSKKKLDAQLDLIGPTIGATTFKYKLSGHAPRLSYDMVELGSSKGLVTANLKCKVFFDPASGKEVEWSLWNDVTSYTA